MLEILEWFFLLSLVFAQFVCPFVSEKTRWDVLLRYIEATKKLLRVRHFVAPAYLIIAAHFNLPSYSAYTILRWVVVVQACFYVYDFYLTKSRFSNYISLLFALIALLFCPLFGFHFPRHVWKDIDLAVAIIFLVFYLFRLPDESEEENKPLSRS